jgi:hypothetical protein
MAALTRSGGRKASEIVMGAPTSEADLEMLFHATAGRLERSDIVFEFLAIMRSASNRRRELIIRYGALVSSFLTICGLVFVSHHLG